MELIMTDDFKPHPNQFDLTEDQFAIQDMARKFTADAITPHAAEWDEKHIFKSKGAFTNIHQLSF